MPATFASVLAAYLEASTFSASELSRRSGLSPDAVSLYLAGDREPSLSNFRKLCRGLTVDPGAFIEKLPYLPPVKYKAANPRGRPKSKPVKTVRTP